MLLDRLSSVTVIGWIHDLSVELKKISPAPFGGKFSPVFPTNEKFSSRSILFVCKIALYWSPDRKFLPVFPCKWKARLNVQLASLEVYSWTPNGSFGWNIRSEGMHYPPQKFKINCDEKLEFSMAKCLKYHGKINSFCFRGGTNMSLKVGNKLLSQLAFSESQRELGNSRNKILFPKIF